MDNVNDISFPNLGITLENLPDGIPIFGREIKFYALIIMCAFLLALYLAQREAKKTGQDSEVYLDSLLATVIPAILGARLYYVVFSWSYYKKHLSEIFQIWNGGLAIYGGVIAGVLTLYIFSRIKKISFGLLLDTWVPGLVLGQALGRWGNFFNREAFGGNSKGLFAMRIPVERIQVSYDSAVHTITPDSGLAYIQVQPTFLYESVLCLAIFIILVLVRRKKKVNGEVFLLYAVLYAAGRFVIEGMRTDQLILCTIGETAIPVSQVVAVGGIVVAVVFFLIGRHKKTVAFYQEMEEE